LKEQLVYNPEQINNQVFEAFDYYLHSTGIGAYTINLYYVGLCKFFDICRLEGWLNINTYWFRGKKNIIHPNNDEIEYIPSEVWNQLNENLNHLPSALQRMVIIIRVMGFRIGEVCNMPFDCLRKRGDSWRIRLTTEKYNIEDELPIVVPELVTVIKEQQEYIRQHLGEKYNQLFCANKYTGKHIQTGTDEMIFVPKPSVMISRSFNDWLNRLAVKCDIRSKNGEIWHFQSHQFRRTVATIMENSGVRYLIIQKYLRHRSPDMQRHYTHLLKQVLGEELEELMREKKYVDIAGKLVATYKPKNPVTELLRQRMHQITTQYGECHRPNLKAPCETINSCGRCEHWRVSSDDMPYLKDDLKRIEEELEMAVSLGMIRQQQGLKGDRERLLNRITSLEAINDYN
jgi:integrase/recombinase XerD